MRTAALLLALLMLSACDDAGMEVRLAPGTTATYASEMTVSRASGPDSVAARWSLSQRVVAEGQTVQGERDLIETLVTYRDEAIPVTLTGRYWLRATSRRLEEVAYESATAGHVLRGPALDLSLPRLVQERVAVRKQGGVSDSTTIRRPARVIVAYPLRAGASWEHFDTGDNFRSTRTVLGETTLQTSEGARACWQIRTLLYFGDDPDGLDWVECLDRDGLVQRTVRQEQIEMRPDGSSVRVVYTEQTVRTNVSR